jgi:hypothetical protein
MFAGDQRVAQTFTAQRTGSLERAEIEAIKPGGQGGDWVMQIVAADGAGTPINSVLASATIADASVPNNASRLTTAFAAPASVVAGQQYALLLTRPGAAEFALHDRDDNPCPGQEFFSLSQNGSWTPNPSAPNPPIYDAVFAVFVKPSNAFTLGALTRNKKKGTATLAVNVPNPGELTGSGQGVKVASTGGAVISKSVAAGPAQLLIKAKGKKKRKLNETGKVKVNPTITYTPTGGNPSIQSTKVKLKKKL